MTTNTNVALADVMSQMTAKVNVGIDEVVSVFVTKWEDGLHAKREELSKKVKDVKSAIEMLETKLIGSVDVSEYTNVRVPMFGVIGKASKPSVNWEDGYNTKKNTITVEVGLQSEDDSGAYMSFRKNLTFPIPQADVDDRANLVAERDQLSAELADVLIQIKSVSRKERQIRGRISEMKMEQAGFSDLINNPDMLKLIEVK